MKKFLVLSVLSLIFCSCEKELSSKLNGNVYEYYSIEIDDWAEGRPIETTERITFLSDTECSVYSYGYDWTYGSRGYEKNNWSDTYTLSYSVESDIITIYKYIRYYNGDHKDIQLKHTGSTLVQVNGERIFYKK